MLGRLETWDLSPWRMSITLPHKRVDETYEDKMELIYICPDAEGEKQRVSLVPRDVLELKFEAGTWVAHVDIVALQFKVPG